MTPYMLNRKAFTLIEIVVSIAILLIIVTITTASFLSLNNNEILEKERLNLKTLLEEARMLTLSSKSDSEWGVHIEENKYVLFRGTTYTEGATQNREIPIHNRVEVSSVALNGGGINILFDRLTGGTIHYGSVVLSLESDLSDQKIVSVSATGIIE